ncbi:Shedu anti-phage system protein SduA domain-containing protein [Micromonospora sp. NPDC005215]
MTQNARLVSRRTSRRKEVSFSKPIVIRAGRDTYFEVVLQYVTRSVGSQLSVKVKYWKNVKGNFRVGFPAEFTLTHDEATRLAQTIEDGLALIQESVDGDYLVVPLDRRIGDDDQLAALVGETVASLATNREALRAIASGPEGRQILSNLQNSVRLAELEASAAELEKALNGGTVKEQFYQEWCEKHSWAFGNIYAMRDDVREIALGDSVDGLLALTSNGLRDILELKRPDMSAIHYDKGHKSYHWSSDASKAIGQCHRYLDALHEGASKGLRDHPGIVAYHPRAIIVLDRSNDWEEQKLRALHGLNARLHSISVMTYDQLLAQANQLLASLRTSS